MGRARETIAFLLCDCCVHDGLLPCVEKFSWGEVLECHPLVLLLRIVLGFDLALANLLNELGWTLNVVINQESKMMGRCFFYALNKNTAHWINVQVTRWTIRRWTDQGIQCVPRHLWDDLVQESKETEVHFLCGLSTSDVCRGVESWAAEPQLVSASNDH